MAVFNTADEIIDTIDFKQLREQKKTLLEMIEKTSGGLEDEKVMGIIHLIDHIQDYAVDVLGKDEKEVFNLEDEA